MHSRDSPLVDLANSYQPVVAACESRAEAEAVVARLVELGYPASGLAVTEARRPRLAVAVEGGLWGVFVGLVTGVLVGLLTQPRPLSAAKVLGVLGMTAGALAGIALALAIASARPRSGVVVRSSTTADALRAQVAIQRRQTRG